ncbi:MAG: hypothetical protein O0V67_07450 [Methanocorpusculum sp.]|nr:hypothetical protein [Methanocorpusculum sp.]
MQNPVTLLAGYRFRRTRFLHPQMLLSGVLALCTVPTVHVILQGTERRRSAGAVFRTHEFTIVGGGPETARAAWIQAWRVLCRR